MTPAKLKFFSPKCHEPQKLDLLVAEWKAELEQKKQRLATKPDQAEGA